MQADHFDWGRSTYLASTYFVMLLTGIILIVDTAKPAAPGSGRQMCAKIQAFLSFGKHQTFQISSNLTYVSRAYAQNFLAYSPLDDLLIFVEPKHQLHVYTAQSIRLVTHVATSNVVYAASCISLITGDRHDLCFVYESRVKANLLSIRVCEVRFNTSRLQFEDKKCIESTIRTDRASIRINGFTIKRDHFGTKRSLLFISTDFGLVYTIFDMRTFAIVRKPIILNDTLTEGSAVITSAGVIYYANKEEHTIHEIHVTRDFRIRYGKIIKSNAIKSPFGLITDECNHLFIATKTMFLVMFMQTYTTIRSIFSRPSDFPVTIERINASTYIYPTVKRTPGRVPAKWQFNIFTFADPAVLTTTPTRLVTRVNRTLSWNEVKTTRADRATATTRTHTSLSTAHPMSDEPTFATDRVTDEVTDPPELSSESSTLPVADESEDRIIDRYDLPTEVDTSTQRRPIEHTVPEEVTIMSSVQESTDSDFQDVTDLPTSEANSPSTDAVSLTEYVQASTESTLVTDTFTHSLAILSTSASSSATLVSDDVTRTTEIPTTTSLPSSAVTEAFTDARDYTSHSSTAETNEPTTILSLSSEASTDFREDTQQTSTAKTNDLTTVLPLSLDEASTDVRHSTQLASDTETIELTTVLPLSTEAVTDFRQDTQQTTIATTNDLTTVLPLSLDEASTDVRHSTQLASDTETIELTTVLPLSTEAVTDFRQDTQQTTIATTNDLTTVPPLSTEALTNVQHSTQLASDTKTNELTTALPVSTETFTDFRGYTKQSSNVDTNDLTTVSPLSTEAPTEVHHYTQLTSDLKTIELMTVLPPSTEAFRNAPQTTTPERSSSEYSTDITTAVSLTYDEEVTTEEHQQSTTNVPYLTQAEVTTVNTEILSTIPEIRAVSSSDTDTTSSSETVATTSSDRPVTDATHLSLETTNDAPTVTHEPPPSATVIDSSKEETDLSSSPMATIIGGTLHPASLSVVTSVTPVATPIPHAFTSLHFSHAASPRSQSLLSSEHFSELETTQPLATTAASTMLSTHETSTQALTTTLLSTDHSTRTTLALETSSPITTSSPTYTSVVSSPRPTTTTHAPTSLFPTTIFETSLAVTTPSPELATTEHERFTTAMPTTTNVDSTHITSTEQPSTRLPSTTTEEPTTLPPSTSTEKLSTFLTSTAMEETSTSLPSTSTEELSTLVPSTPTEYVSWATTDVSTLETSLIPSTYPTTMTEGFTEESSSISTEALPETSSSITTLTTEVSSTEYFETTAHTTEETSTLLSTASTDASSEEPTTTELLLAAETSPLTSTKETSTVFPDLSTSEPAGTTMVVTSSSPETPTSTFSLSTMETTTEEDPATSTITIAQSTLGLLLRDSIVTTEAPPRPKLPSALPSNELLNALLRNASNSTDKRIRFDLADLPAATWNLSMQTNDSVELDFTLPNSNVTTNLSLTNIAAERFSTSIVGSPVNLQMDQVQAKQFSLAMNLSGDSNQTISDVVIGHVKSEQFNLDITKSDNMNIHVQQVDSDTAELFFDSKFCTSDTNLQINLNLSKNGTIRYGDRPPIRIGAVFTRVHMLKQSCDLDQPFTVFFDICQGQNPCLNGGTCQSQTPDYDHPSYVPKPSEISYQCLCPAYFYGEQCEQSQYPMGYCINDGNLTYVLDAYNRSVEQCECAQGYGGQHCEENIDDCVGVTCSLHGICQDGIDSYNCSCFDGYFGSQCEKRNVETVILQVATKSFATVAIMLIAAIAGLVVASDIHTYLTTKKQPVKPKAVSRMPRASSELYENSLLLLAFGDAPIELNELPPRSRRRKRPPGNKRPAKKTKQTSPKKRPKKTVRKKSSKNHTVTNPAYESIL